MMRKYTTFAAAIMLTAGLATVAEAADFSKQIKARQSVMQLYAFNMGQLGAMAKGETAYDAAAAKGAAGNILAVSKLYGGAMWPKGSDNTVPGLENATRAKPENWTNYPKAKEAHMNLVAAAETLAAEAGNSLDALKANIGAAGEACGACHKPFRAPKQ